MPEFSIIIPVYNIEKYLEECVTSVTKQTYENYELILIDDGSSDKSGSLCDEFAMKDDRIYVIHQENSGLSAARNAGVDYASGRYIIFLDSDDFWRDEQCLEKIYHRLQKSNVQVLSFNYIKFTNTQQYSSYFRKQESMPLNYKDSFQFQIEKGIWIACAWNKVMKRELFDNGELRFVRGITSEDMDWCVRLALKARSFDYLNEIIVCYRQREKSISQSVSEHKVSMVMDNIDNCLILIENNDNSHANLLKPFIGYQYGTILSYLAILPKSCEREILIQRAKNKQYLLKWSNSKKVKLLDVTTSVGGLKLTLFLLKFRSNI